MDLAFRAAAVFFALFIIMRIAGSRQFAEMTTFDAALIIVIAEVTGNALSGEDYSITASVIVIATLVFLDILVSLLKHRFKGFGKVSEGVPMLLVENGRTIDKTLHKERIDKADILATARKDHGLERLDQIKYAVLERDGTISIVPREGATP